MRVDTGGVGHHVGDVALLVDPVEQVSYGSAAWSRPKGSRKCREKYFLILSRKTEKRRDFLQISKKMKKKK